MADGLPSQGVGSLLQWRDGSLWGRGWYAPRLFRYDGARFTAFSEGDGVADEGGVNLWTLALDGEGDLWVGTMKGVARYDGSSFRAYGRQDGLRGDRTYAILHDRRGWVGHWDGGITRTDGTVYQTLTMADGLVHDGIQGLLEDDAGDIWIATEVAVLPLPMQSHLGRVLIEGRARRTGVTESQAFDVRVVASSSIDLETQVELGGFRPEVYQFLAQSRLQMPALRERAEDIPELVRQLAAELAQPTVELDDEAVARLQGHPFPGNVRQLRRVLEQAQSQRRDGGSLPAESLALPG